MYDVFCDISTLLFDFMRSMTFFMTNYVFHRFYENFVTFNENVMILVGFVCICNENDARLMKSRRFHKIRIVS